MGSILSNSKEKGNQFTIFENDQVLTADQLNELFAYLDVQDRLSRVTMLGTGIICGLKTSRRENEILLSKGAAITTEGDLLYYSKDMNFQAYVAFEDDNAQYPLWKGTEVIYQLVEDTEGHRDAALLGDFESREGKSLKDYAVILYLEDYINDPDLCTGLDCDNKGAVAIKDQKVLLVPKSMSHLLLKPDAEPFFELQDVHVPRVVLNAGINTRTRLETAFKDTFGVRKILLDNLSKAYKLCEPLLQDVFEGNPVAFWTSSLNRFFTNTSFPDHQHLYNFLKDLADAYNELRDSLLGEKAYCIQRFNFPKHVLLGSVSKNANKLKRFTVNDQADLEYRHSFYASPVLNRGEENVQKIRFMFMRMHVLISNFFFPENGNIKITPGRIKDSTPGQRSIPYYYKYDEALPVNLYWDYSAHIKHKENHLLYYHADRYPERRDEVVNPLKYNITGFDFFNIEGYLGLPFSEAEEKIEKIIEDNNLPVRVTSLQLERELKTIIPKKWKFPYLQVNDFFLKKSLTDHLNQSVKIQDDLLKNYTPQKDDDPPKTVMSSTFNNFKSSKLQVENELKQGSLIDRLQSIKPVFDATISAATEVKVKTSNFSFCGTSLPHDFLINTDVISKADLLKDLVDKKVESKKEDLILGNFMRKNPGLEYSSGVVPGGTFVLVYGSSDKRVLAGFMLPYSYVDQDLLEELPAPAPEPPVLLPKFDIDKLFIPKPPYVNLVENRFKDLDIKINDNYKILQADLSQKANMSVLETINTNQNQVFSNVINTLSGISTDFKNVYQNINTSQNQLLNSMVTAFTGISANIPTKFDPIYHGEYVLYKGLENDLKLYSAEQDIAKKETIATEIEKNLTKELESKEFNLRNPEDVNLLLEFSKVAKDLPSDISENLTKQIMGKIK